MPVLPYGITSYFTNAETNPCHPEQREGIRTFKIPRSARKDKIAVAPGYAILADQRAGTDYCTCNSNTPRPKSSLAPAAVVPRSTTA